MTEKNGGPAFPTTQYFDEKPVEITDGMSLRDWFAGQAMNQMLVDSSGPVSMPYMAKACYAVADAMLAEREKGKP